MKPAADLTNKQNPPDFPHRKSAEPPQASALQVRAMYDFSAEDADELNFHAGDIIEVLDQSDRFWWKGVLRGRTGLFPVNYTNPV
ncbi:hypothetical protein Q8A67_014120 [Cirrhinus molitorella]|uniref:Osteoclast-stimulating factor 1 n=1 Tax=Cirrhinus molitorella TaxID=172907 RepID=A0AA88TJG0_9TELE|nr:hypothetical protein Q8A67_014120 [Cirrhinus molitorella]